MSGILMTQYDGAILGPIAKVLGLLMEGIFKVLDLIGIPNIGLSIILFTILIYLLMLPLTIKQQKFSKLSAKMNPEIQAIQAKYKNRKDNESMMAMNEETNAVYAKYGVSPTGSCVQLLIQMPVLFALYRVIYAIPAYVGKIGDTFRILADKIISVDNGSFIQNSGVESISNIVKMYGKSMEEGNLQNGIVDVLNMLSSSDMATVAEHYGLYNLQYEGEYILSQMNAAGEIVSRGLLDGYNNFLGLNMANSPSFMVSDAFAAGNYLLVVGALMIPILSALTQWINTKLMPQASKSNEKTGNETADAMAQSMKTMNVMMPFMSAFFCYTLPAGMGLYWISGSVVRSIQQVLINKYIDHMDMEEVVNKNQANYEKKMEKLKAYSSNLNSYASMNTRNISSKSSMTSSEKEELVKKANDYYSQNAKPGSIAAKANMVKEYNEKNNK